MQDANASIASVLAAYHGEAQSLDESDGLSLAFSDWRFNLRCSNTEPLVRLNVESTGGASDIHAKVRDIALLLGGTPA